MNRYLLQRSKEHVTRNLSHRPKKTSKPPPFAPIQKYINRYCSYQRKTHMTRYLPHRPKNTKAGTFCTGLKTPKLVPFAPAQIHINRYLSHRSRNTSPGIFGTGPKTHKPSHVKNRIKT